jgi:hypothetical protein
MLLCKYFDRRKTDLLSRPRRLSGAVTTAEIVKLFVNKISRLGTAKSGVPINIMFIYHHKIVMTFNIYKTIFLLLILDFGSPAMTTSYCVSTSPLEIFFNLDRSNVRFVEVK